MNKSQPMARCVRAIGWLSVFYGKSIQMAVSRIWERVMADRISVPLHWTR